MTPATLAIVDDLFPYGGSGFRLTEYEHILRGIRGSLVASTLSSLDWLGQGHRRNSIIAEWREANPDIADRLVVVDDLADVPAADAFYTVFLNNARSMLSIVDQRQTPFAFTLYPGGGMGFGAEALGKLEQVLTHPLLLKVVVTQPAVLQWVLDSGIIEPRRIEYVYGVVTGDEPPLARPGCREIDAAGPVRLAFIAHRYEPRGTDKGLDLFLDAAESLLAQGRDLTCHIVGPWNARDLTTVADPSRYVLHGVLHVEDLKRVLTGIDIGVFPTRSDVLELGSFDGFPTAAAVLAGMAGAAVVTTNPLQQQTPLIAGLHYVEIDPSVCSVVDAVAGLMEDPVRLASLRLSGSRAMDDIFCNATQIPPRLRMLAGLASGAGA